MIEFILILVFYNGQIKNQSMVDGFASKQLCYSAGEVIKKESKGLMHPYDNAQIINYKCIEIIKSEGG